MPALIARILDGSCFALAARIVLTFPFSGSGLSKLIDFSGDVAEMAGFGLKPAAVFNVLVLTTPTSWRGGDHLQPVDLAGHRRARGVHRADDSDCA
jgi:hypothetical protein